MFLVDYFPTMLFSIYLSNKVRILQQNKGVLQRAENIFFHLKFKKSHKLKKMMFKNKSLIFNYFQLKVVDPFLLFKLKFNLYFFSFKLSSELPKIKINKPIY